MIGVDARCGLVTGLRLGRLPGGLHTAFADLADTSGYAVRLGNPTVAGASWHDPEEACRRALGEAAERYCGHLVPLDRLVTATWHELVGEGGSVGVGGACGAVDPASLALYGKAHLDRPGFPFTGLRRDQRVQWVRGAGPDGTPVWVPAALVWLVPFSDGGRDRPIVLPISAGIAAGADPVAARDAALAEVVERHALATAWAVHRELPELAEVRLPPVPGVRLRAHAVPNLVNAPVVLVTAEDAGGRVGVGCALAPRAADPVAAAASKAAAEALQSLDTTAQLAAGALPEWEHPTGPLPPHRADLAFSAGYRADFGDVTDVTCHLQLLADPAFAARVRARIAAGGGPVAPVRGPVDLEATLRARGLIPITVDVTTDDVAALGLSVVRVIVPGLRATAPAAFPFFGDGAEPLPSDADPLPVPHA
jgi:ribosomal protein S12 methylthiotransferase accessory factor